jgi:prephenate dehydrogenase
MQDMADHLTSGAVVIIAGTGHQRALEDAVRTLPSHASVICATPIAWTRPGGTGASSAKGPSSVRPFADAVAGISPSPSAHPDAVGVVQAILEAGGATAFFADPREFDALATAASVLPTLIATTLVRVVLGETPTTSSPNDFDRAGGIAFAEMTRALEDPAQGIEGDVAIVSDHALRWIEQVIADLQATRQKILDGDTSPIGIDAAASRRRQWITTRKSSPELAILPDLPTPARRRLFF